MDRSAPTVIQGLGVSAGSAVGPAVVIADPPTVPAGEPVGVDPDADWTRISAAIEAVAADLERRAGAVAGPAADILQATAMMARDPSLAKAIKHALADGAGPVGALHTAVDDVCATFIALGGYFAERTTDLRDVCNRASAHLLGQPAPGVPELKEPSILVGRDLAPADAAVLSPESTLAIVTEEGGATGHTAILAAQLGIPTVVHAIGVHSVSPGTVLAVDGSTGTVTIAPDADLVRKLDAQRVSRRALLAATRGPGSTADGHPVALLANVGTGVDARAAADVDLEGVGLFRTEFLFLDRASAPTVAEQTAAYSAVFAAFAGRPVIVRTLDAGADKPLAFADLGPEANPALGRRGVRLCVERVELIDDQLAAIAAAAIATAASVAVMAPMVATPGEARWFADRVRAHGLPRAGAMIEIPAAALRAGAILDQVDFVSIGTNDLAQYTMAADRTHGELAHLLDPWQPALLDLVATTASAGVSAGKPVGVCGESAGDPLLALVYTGFGVTSLSMAAGRVAAVRYALSRHALAECRQLAVAARSAEDPAAARAAVAALTDAATQC